MLGTNSRFKFLLIMGFYLSLGFLFPLEYSAKAEEKPESHVSPGPQASEASEKERTVDEKKEEDDSESPPKPIEPHISNRCLKKATSPEGEVPLFFNFQGKSTHVPWDLGVIEAAVEDIPQMSNGKVELAGNSSGSMLAAYFACWGVNPQSIKEAQKIMTEFDYSLIPTSDKKKIIRFLSKAVPVEEDPSEVSSIIREKILKHGKTKCKPEAPLIIAAANRDVLDRRLFNDQNGNPTNAPALYRAQTTKTVYIPSAIKDGKKVDAYGELTRVYDRKSKMVYDETKVYDATTKEEIETRREPVGKICTYFVTQVMMDKLSQIPYEERECELRLIETVNDLHLAIMASIAEPTYFDEAKETNFRKIQESGLTFGYHQNRAYVGGYLNSIMAADLKHLEPDTYVIGTGVTPFSAKIDTALTRWFIVSPNERLEEGQKSLDFEVLPQIDWSSRDAVDPKALLKAGYLRAKAMFAAHASRCTGFQPKKHVDMTPDSIQPSKPSAQPVP